MIRRLAAMLGLVFGLGLTVGLVGCSPDGSASTATDATVDRPAVVPAGFLPAERHRLDCCRWLPVDDAWQATDDGTAYWQFDIDPARSFITGHDGCGEFDASAFGRFVFDDGGVITTGAQPTGDESCPAGTEPIPVPVRGDVVWAADDMSRLIVVDDQELVRIRLVSDLRYPRRYDRSLAPGADALIEDLALARQRWGANGPSDYELESRVRCDGCLAGGQGTTINVRNGRTEGATNSFEAAVEELFQFLGDGLAIGFVSDVGFDPDDGHPTFFTLTSDYVESDIDVDIPPTDLEYTLTPS